MSSVLRRTLSVGVAAMLLAGCGARTVAPVASSASVAAPVPVASSESVASSVPAATPASANTTAPAPQRLIDHVHWTSTDKGRQLQVFPTTEGRQAPDDDLAAAWHQVLAFAPTAGSAGMYDQFRCHWEFARLVEPDKPSWNLEPWRPAVGYAATVAAECNPGGAEN